MALTWQWVSQVVIRDLVKCEAVGFPSGWGDWDFGVRRYGFGAVSEHGQHCF
jgi:hypothetical protein